MAVAAPSDAIGAILDFFEAAIHQIIYVRGVYPEGLAPDSCIYFLFILFHLMCCPALFKRHRKYGVAAFMCEHHGVKDYIEVVVKSCKEWLMKVKMICKLSRVTNSFARAK